MVKVMDKTDPAKPVEIELRNPALAALWAWLWPGAGHIYQRRYGKAILFMVCILSTYFFGLALGGGHVVYASFKKPDIRYHYICQIGMGLPAIPALIQHNRVIVQKTDPLFAYDDPTSPGLKTAYFAPPTQPVNPDAKDQLANWHRAYHSYFEIGTLYTMVAGLLNMLVVCDAFAGPAFPTEEKKKKPPPGKKASKDGDKQSSSDESKSEGKSND